MCVRKFYRSDALWILSGVAIRLARKMGLHRDGMRLGLSPFETEMRRRLWVHIAHVDFRTADVLGMKPSLDLSTADAKVPLNIEDEDLQPDMIELPAERKGVTSITPCLLRCEIVGILCSSSPIAGDMGWDVLYSPDVSLAKKDSIIKNIENTLETKYMRYCDPTNSLHYFISIMIRSGICKLTLLAHSLRQFANKSVKVPQSERDIVFSNAIKLLEYVNVLRGGYHGVEKYLWMIGTSYLWNVMLYLLIEIRHRKTGPEVDKSWRLIGVVFSERIEQLDESARAVFRALGKWTLEVWDDHVAASKSAGLPRPSPPEYIEEIRRARGVLIDVGPENRLRTQSTIGNNGVQSQKSDGNGFEFEGLDSYGFSDLSSFEMDLNEWIQWDQLVADQSGFAIL